MCVSQAHYLDLLAVVRRLVPQKRAAAQAEAAKYQAGLDALDALVRFESINQSLHKTDITESFNP